MYVKGDEVIMTGLYTAFVCGVSSSVPVLLDRVVVSGRCEWSFVGVGERTPEGIEAAAAQFAEVWECWEAEGLGVGLRGSVVGGDDG